MLDRLAISHTVLYIFFVIGVVNIFWILMFAVKKTQWSCRALGWHDGNGTTNKTFDGCSIHSVCSKCGKEVMQDG